MTETTFPVSTTASDILINLPRNVSDLLKHSIDSSGLAGKVKIETHEYRQTKELIRHGESCQLPEQRSRVCYKAGELVVTHTVPCQVRLGSLCLTRPGELPPFLRSETQASPSHPAWESV